MERSGYFLPFIITFFMFFLVNTGIYSQTPAFPGAEGYGKYTEGGRGGAVVEVTNLNNSGPGSLRDALVNKSGPRTVVFRVGGVIELESKIEMKGDAYVTIAGQTAPGGGICLKNYSLFINESEHIIVRYIRSRLGDQGNSDEDAISVRSCNNVILDHCSMSWSIDAILDVTHQSSHITVQWSILSEALHNSHHEKGAHGYAAGWDGKNGCTYHHNLIASCNSRTPRLDKFPADDGTRDDLIDIVNNVIYNWNGYGAYGGEQADVNWQNNFYRYGPATSFGVRSQIFKPDADCKVYVDGNYVAGYPDVTADNSLGIRTSKDLSDVLVNQPFVTQKINMETAKAAFESVMANAGARLPETDAVDLRIIHDVQSGTGSIIDSQDEVGGWPEYAAGTAPVDTDGDGMPDEWEDANGLDKNDPDDRNITNEEGYTNLEVYLNSLVKQGQYLARPIHLDVDSVVDQEVYLSWEDVSAKETGYVIERKSDGSWEQLASLPANSVNYTDNNIPDVGDYYYRMKTLGDAMETEYTDSITVTVEEATAIYDYKEPINEKLHVSPNPFQSTVHIGLELGEAAHVKMDVRDITGKTVMHITNAYKGAGKNSIKMDGSDLQKGLYLVNVRVNDKPYQPVKIIKE